MPRSPFASMQDASAGSVEKIMAITPAEFERGMERMDVMTCTSPGTDQQTWTSKQQKGTAIVTFAKLPAKTLGANMTIMQASVTIAFDNMPNGDRDIFLDAFDLTFQRGGG